jgi:proteasome lid subunit RPN8/RPN11
VEDDTLVFATPLGDMLEASGFSPVTPNRSALEEEFLELLVRVGLMRDAKWKPTSRAPKLAGMRKVAEFLRPMVDFDQEYVVIVCLDDEHRLLGHAEVHIGGTAEAPIQPRMLLKYAMLLSASRVWWAHNHPSGIAEPSYKDVQTTSAVGEVFACHPGLYGEMMGSLVIAAGGYANVQTGASYPWESP